MDQGVVPFPAAVVDKANGVIIDFQPRHIAHIPAPTAGERIGFKLIVYERETVKYGFFP